MRPAGPTAELVVSETIPAGFLRFSKAVALLAQGIWGGLGRPTPVIEVKQYEGQVSVTFGPWKEKAGQCLTLAAVNEQIPVYVFGQPQAEAGRPGPELTRVPGAVLKRLIKPRGCLPDHPRVSMRAVENDGQLFRALNTGLLIVRKSEFDAWYQREHRKGKWPSQRGKSKKEGRPSHQTDGLRNAVAAIMQAGKITIAELRRRLVSSGRTDVPSEDTLARVVDELYRETGEARFRRHRRGRAK
jgi:hypothetical protein